MSKNFLNEFSDEDENLGKEEEVDIYLRNNSTETTISYQRAQLNKINEELEGLKQDRKQRKTFSVYLFAFTCVYMTATLIVVYLCGLGVMHLSDAIIITLLTTTLAEVIGMFNFVARYLFHHK